MTDDEIIERLTAATDYDPNTYSAEQIASGVFLPIVDGDATRPDEQGAAEVLARFVAAVGVYESTAPIAAPADSYAVKHAAWVTNRENAHAALDRSIRSVMTILQDLAPIDSGTGLIRDLGIRAMDPTTPIANLDSTTTATAFVGYLIRAANRIKSPYSAATTVNPVVLEALRVAALAYDSAHKAPEPQPRASRSSVAASSPLTEYQAARAAALAYVTYLDAVDAPDVP